MKTRKRDYHTHQEIAINNNADSSVNDDEQQVQNVNSIQKTTNNFQSQYLRHQNICPLPDTNKYQYYPQQKSAYPLPEAVFIPDTSEYNQKQQSSYPVPIVFPNTNNYYPESFLQSNQFSNQQRQQVFEYKNLENKDSQWSDTEVEVLIAYLDENYKNWSSGNKSKFYQSLVDKDLLPDKNNEQIKNKLNKLRNSYLKEKKSTNKTGSAPTKWKWFDKLDEIFGRRENVSPTYLASSSTNDTHTSDEKVGEASPKEVGHKSKKKKNNNYEAFSDLIISMNQSKDNFLVKKIELQGKEIDSKMELERYKIDKDVELRRLELEIQREKLEVEKLNAENLKKKLELESKKFLS